MTDVRTDSWSKFTKEVAMAQAEGKDVLILTGPGLETSFAATIVDRPQDADGGTQA